MSSAINITSFPFVNIKYTFTFLAMGKRGKTFYEAALFHNYYGILH